MRKLAAAAAGLLIVGLLAWLAIRAGSGTSQPRATLSPSPMAQVPVGSSYPAAYAVVYRLEEHGTQLWEVLRVDRPFSGSDLFYATAGAPAAGDQPRSGSISTATGLYAVSSQGVELVSGRQPGPPSGDEYLGQELADLTGRGLARSERQTATVAGRPCAVYRFAGPPAGPVPKLGSGDHDDLCLDAAGLVLREVWTYHGQVVERRTAREVQTAAKAIQDPKLPAVPDTAGAGPLGPAGATVTPDADPAAAIAEPPVPAGFAAFGPAEKFRLPDPSAPSQTVAQSVVWTFEDGARTITVEAGSERGGPPWHDGDTVTATVDLAGLGPAQTAVRSDGYQLRLDLGGGAWVRVLGTVPLAQLVAYGELLKHA